MSEVDRLQSELITFTREARAGFITSVAMMRNQLPSNLFKLQTVATTVGAQFANLLSRQFLSAGENAASAANENLNRLDLFFNQSLAADTLQHSQARITAGIMQTADAAARIALLNGLTLINSIGLSTSQVEAASSYKKLLQTSSLETIQQELRSRDFEDVIESTVLSNPLTPDEVSLMVSRYIDRQIDFRAQLIGQTEAVRVVNHANQIFWIQQVNAGKVLSVTQQWITSEGKVRQSHQSLNGTTVPLGNVFVSGGGNRLLYPGDPRAPQSETLHCRCVLITEVEQ